MMAAPTTHNQISASTRNQSGMALPELESASFWANVAVVIFTLAAASAGGFALYFSSKASAVRDAELVRFQEESRVSIANADARSAEANEKAAGANERTGKLEVEAGQQRERAAKAEASLLELRQRLAPRQIKGKDFLKLLEGKPKMPVEIMFLRDDPEAWGLAMQLRDFLRQATWNPPEPVPIPPTDVPRLADQPSTMGAGGQPTGVAVVIRATTQEEFRLFGDREAPTAFNALQQALLHSLGSISSTINDGHLNPSPTPGILRIVVGPKP